MLVLTRHNGEQIIIGEKVVVTVVAIEGNKVRLGIQAPRDVRVDRKEVHDRRVAEEIEMELQLETGCPVG
jgi:carbon storage regulator